VKERSILLGKNIVCDARNLIFLLVQTSLIPNSCRLGIQPDRRRGLSQLSQKILLSGLTLTCVVLVCTWICSNVLCIFA